MKHIAWGLLCVSLLASGCDRGGKTTGAPASSASAQASDKPGDRGSDKPSGTAAVATVSSSEVAAAEDVCKAYEKTLEACIASAPAAQKEGFRQTLKAHRDAMANAGDAYKRQMADGCRTGLATAKQNPACK